jgi:predicted amidohydrolase
MNALPPKRNRKELVGHDSLAFGTFVALLLTAAPALAIESNLVLSVYQGVCQEGDFTANLTTAREVVKQARERGSHFLALPECFLSGYESREAVQRGARSLDDPEVKQFIAESAAHDMVVLVGLARKSGDGLSNTELVIHRGAACVALSGRTPSAPGLLRRRRDAAARDEGERVHAVG